MMQLSRWQQQTGIDLTAEDEMNLSELPDYMPHTCLWVETGLRARGFNEYAIAKSVRYANREGQCCPGVTGGDEVDAACQPTGKTTSYQYDASDTGTFQFNGFKPGGGFKASSPAITFCQEGVRRFLSGSWTEEVTYPCEQGQILADSELQLDMMYWKVLGCGFGPWEPVRSNGRVTYPCQRINPLSEGLLPYMA